MSLTSSLFSGVSGLNSQSRVLSVIGDNIANISTTGFKAGNVSFSSLVAGDVSVAGGSGALARNRQSIDQQGLIQGTNVGTDVAISGNGFFVVKNQENEFLYTRSGSFRQDEIGNFVNTGGFVLQAYPLDNDGNIPGNSQILESLVDVNTRSISAEALATTSISLGLNLDAAQDILTGAGDTAKPVSTANTGIAASTILIPGTDLVADHQLVVDTVSGSGATTSNSFTFGGVAISATPSGGAPIFGAPNASTVFTGLTDSTDGITITLGTGASAQAISFRYQQVSPSPTLGQFNSLQTLADAINNSPLLTARISNETLYFGAVDPSLQMDTDSLAGGTATIHTTLGFTAADNVTTTDSFRFNSLNSLATAVNGQSAGALNAIVESATNDSSVRINSTDPTATITFDDDDGAGGASTLIAEFGFPLTVAAGGAGTALDEVYAADGIGGSNMSSGTITPDFSRNIRVFDAQGRGRDLLVSFVKIGDNRWASELYSANPDEDLPSGVDPQLAAGEVLFNGDGSLANISPSLRSDIVIQWSDSVAPSTVTLDLGTFGLPAGTPGASAADIGLTDGLSQFAGNYNVQFANQNGASSGLLSSVEINEEGFIIANFSNGESRRIFRIPLATFPNPNGLTPDAGNVFQASDASGDFSLNTVGDSGVGVLSVSALEGSNTELADELTQLIVAQRAFQANTRVITAADELLEELNRI